MWVDERTVGANSGEQKQIQRLGEAVRKQRYRGENLCDHTDDHSRACDCPVRFRGRTGLPRNGAAACMQAVQRMTAWSLFESSDIDPSAGAADLYRLLGLNMSLQRSPPNLPFIRLISLAKTCFPPDSEGITNREPNMTVAICLCGCGEATKGGKFRPGHDQKLRVAIEEAAGGLESLRAIVEKHLGHEISTDKPK